MTTVDEARAARLSLESRLGRGDWAFIDAFEAAVRAEFITEGERYEWQKDKQRAEAKLAALREDADGRIVAWAGCVQRFVDAAPIEAVKRETGVRGGHSTPPDRKARRDEAHAIVEHWLARDRAALAATPAESDYLTSREQRRMQEALAAIDALREDANA